MNPELFRHVEPVSESGFFKAARRCRVVSVQWFDPVTLELAPASRWTLRGPDGRIIRSDELPAEIGPGDVIHLTIESNGPITYPPRVVLEDL